MPQLSKTQVDRLGDRLRKGSVGESDLRLLDEYRRSFGEAYETVVQTIRAQLQLEPTGRPAKSTGSVVEKLHRESIRLSQMQDIAGCRVVVPGIVEQDGVVASLCAAFPGAFVVDRRTHPSYGYRAVHVIVNRVGKPVEIQIRTTLQHSWAEFSEKVSDIVDPAIKYGGGPNSMTQMLGSASTAVARFEEMEKRIVDVKAKIAGQPVEEKLNDILKTLEHDFIATRALLSDSFSEAIAGVAKIKRERHDISN